MPAWWAAPALGAGLSMLGDQLGFASAKSLSNTAHQREVRDLRAAGLNPILSAMGGPGASTPPVPDFGGAAGDAVSSARAAGEIGLLKQQTRKASAEADVVKPLADSTRWLQEANARAALAGVPWKEAVGAVATDAKSVYREMQKGFREGIHRGGELRERSNDWFENRKRISKRRWRDLIPRRR